MRAGVHGEAVRRGGGEVYGQDLAYVHNVGFGNFAEGSAPGVLNILRQRGVSSGLVIDLGCGGGLWARRLVDAGYRVVGIDLSPDMIALARRRVPEGNFRTGSFLDGDFPPCAAITSLGNASITCSTNAMLDLRFGGCFAERIERCAREGC